MVTAIGLCASADVHCTTVKLTLTCVGVRPHTKVSGEAWPQIRLFLIRVILLHQERLL